MSEDIRQSILDEIDDVVSNFLYYDRKESSDLPLDSIENAVRDGLITVDEIVMAFKDSIESNWREGN